MLSALGVCHSLVALALVVLVLVQQSKGGLSAFGGGGAQGVLGSLAPQTLWAKLTGALAVLFFVLSLALVYVDRQKISVSQLLLTSPMPVESTSPVEGESA